MSSIFILIFILAYFGMLFVKKTEHKLNAIVWMIITVFAEICLGSFLCSFVALTPIRITLITSCVVYGIIALTSWLYIILKKEHQKFYINVLDVICVVIIIGFVVSFAIKTFGNKINFTFWNSDPAVHFENAMYYVNNHKLSGMWFASYYLGTLIEIFRPFIQQVNYYKVLILADQIALVMQALMFFVLIRESMTNIWKRVIGMGICLLYICGYPMLCTYQGFFYWGICVSIIAFLVYMVRCYRSKEIYRFVSSLYMMCGCFAVFICYMLFAPVVYVSVFLSLVAVAKKEGKVFTWSNVILALRIFLVPCALGLYFCYFQWFLSNGMSAAGVLTLDGGIYSELYINFIIWLPFILYWLVNRFRDKKITENEIFLVVIFAFIIFLFILVYNHKASTYYYYKLYYPLWLIVFTIFPYAVFELWERQRSMVISLVIIIVFLAVMQFGHCEEKVLQRTNLTTWDHSKQFFDLYTMNEEYSKCKYGLYDARLLDSCQYVIKNLPEEKVPIIADLNTYAYAYWYDAITVNSSADYYAWYYSFDEIKNRIETGECDYFIMIANSSIYQEHADYWNTYPIISNNDWGIIYKAIN